MLSAPKGSIQLVNLSLCCLETDTAQLGPGQGRLVPAHTRNREINVCVSGDREWRVDPADTAPSWVEDPVNWGLQLADVRTGVARGWAS